MTQKKLYVSNIPFTVTIDVLKNLFARFGNIEDAVIISDNKTGRSKGFGFITFENEKDAKEALCVNGQDLEGREIKVALAKERESGGRSGKSYNDKNSNRD